MYMWLLEPDQISHTQSMVAKNDSQIGTNVHHVKKSLKTQHDRIPIDPAIGHRFIAQKKKN